MRINEVYKALENSTPAAIKALVFELVDLTMAGLGENPSPAICNKAVDCLKGHKNWVKYVRSYLIEFAPFKIDESGRFGGKMKRGKLKYPLFQEWLENYRLAEKEAKQASKPKANAVEKVLALWQEVEESEKFALLQKMSETVNKEKLLEILANIS